MYIMNLARRLFCIGQALIKDVCKMSYAAMYFCKLSNGKQQCVIKKKVDGDGNDNIYNC